MPKPSMGRPPRTDNTKAKTFKLSETCRELIDILASHLSESEGGNVTKTDVVERAIKVLAKKCKIP